MSGSNSCFLTSRDRRSRSPRETSPTRSPRPRPTPTSWPRSRPPPPDQLVDLDEFGGWEHDRPDEGEYFGYDFSAYAKALSEAWNQESIDRAKAAVSLNDSRAAAAS